MSICQLAIGFAGGEAAALCCRNVSVSNHLCLGFHDLKVEIFRHFLPVIIDLILESDDEE